MTQKEKEWFAYEIKRIEAMIELVHQEDVIIAKTMCNTSKGSKDLEKQWNHSFEEIRDWEAVTE